MSTSPAPVVVTICRNQLTGHDAATGAQVFTHRFGESSLGLARVVTVRILEVLVTATRIFVVAGQEVHCFEYPTGRPIGQAHLPGGMSVGGESRATMLHAGDRLFVGVAGMLHCLSQDGRLLWSAPGYHDPPMRDSMGLAVPGAVRQADDMGSK